MNLQMTMVYELRQLVQRPGTLDRALYWLFQFYLRRVAKRSFRATRIYPHPKRLKCTPNALKRHRETFHLARHDPEHWEQERETTLLESLREARERVNTVDREANKELLKHSRQSQRRRRCHEHSCSQLLVLSLHACVSRQSNFRRIAFMHIHTTMPTRHKTRC